MQYMIYTRIFSGLLISRKVSCIFHNHDGIMIPALIGTDRAHILICQSITFLAVAHILLRAHNRLRQTFHPRFGHIDQMKRKALGRFMPDTGKPRQLLY